MNKHLVNNDDTDELKGLNSCLCGEIIDKEKNTCGNDNCIELYEYYKQKMISFFDLLENKSIWDAFEIFEEFDLGMQVGILIELDDIVFIEYLQALNQQNVLEIFQFPNEMFRLRLLEFLEPNMKKVISEEMSNLDLEEQEAVKNFLFSLLNIIFLSVQKKQP